MDHRRALAREVRRIAGPAILHSLLQTLVFVVDRAMLGRHGSSSLAAMQLVGTLNWSLWSVFAAFEVGTIARVGRHVGAGDRVAARRVALISLAIAVCLGSAVALATPLVIAALPLAAENASPEVLAEGSAYLSATLLASPMVYVAATSTAILQAAGDTRTPLVIGVFANVLHLGVNRVLILGAFGLPALGARGAGISTALTFTLEAVLATLALASRSRGVSLRRETAGAASGSLAAEARELVVVGGPAFAERALYHLGFLGYALIIARLGDAPMAANQSLMSIESICFLSADGFGVAAAALVAQKLGAGKPEEAHRAAWISTRYAIFTLTAFGLAALALRGIVLPLFSQDEAVLAIGRRTIPLLALAQPFMAAGIVLAQSLRGAARTRHALVVSLVCGVFVRLVATWSLALGLGLGLVGVWLGSTADWIARTLILGLMLRRAEDLRERGTVLAAE